MVGGVVVVVGLSDGQPAPAPQRDGWEGHSFDPVIRGRIDRVSRA